MESSASDEIEIDIDSDATEIKIEPYEVIPWEIEEFSSEESSNANKDSESHVTSTKLFLKSLQDILEKCPVQQNLLARFKIQKVLYNVMYGKKVINSHVSINIFFFKSSSLVLSK